VIEDVFGMAFVAAIGALIASGVLALPHPVKRTWKSALVVQFAWIFGLALLFWLGAGLQSPPGYPHWLIPIVFSGVLLMTHWVWRVAHPTEVTSNG
jgi:hypothetical protein